MGLIEFDQTHFLFVVVPLSYCCWATALPTRSVVVVSLIIAPPTAIIPPVGAVVGVVGGAAR
jgi:hypothetical protein